MTTLRLETLDRLRGVAALCVFAGHVNVVRDKEGLFHHSYLAVDFFFLISGFVIGAAYERRLAAALRDYARIRLIRLYPLMALSGVMGGVIALFDAPVFSLPALFVMHLLLIPFIRPREEVFPLNNVLWSLFFELTLNAVHAVARPILSNGILAALVSISAVSLVVVDGIYGTLGLGYRGDNFFLGFIRATFPFFAGLLVWRVWRRFPRVKAPYFLVAGVLGAALTMPNLPGVPDSVIVVGLFPILLIAAAQGSIGNWAARLAVESGKLSYPLYALHLPLLHTAVLMRPTEQPGVVRGSYWAVVVVMVLAVSWAAGRFFDEPVRAWLRSPRLKFQTR